MNVMFGTETSLSYAPSGLIGGGCLSPRALPYTLFVLVVYKLVDIVMEGGSGGKLWKAVDIVDNFAPSYTSPKPLRCPTPGVEVARRCLPNGWARTAPPPRRNGLC